MQRRDLLVRTGLTFAAAALATWPDTSPRAVASSYQVSDWEAVRALFSVSPDYLHFGGLYLASHPAPVQQAIEAHRRGLDDNPVDYMAQNGAREAAVLTAAARYVGGSPRDIALTDSTTMGLGLLYTGLDIRADQELLTTNHDFYATHEGLREASRRTGAPLRQVALYRSLASVSEDEILESLRQGIGERTRLLAVTWVHSSTGLKLPIRRIADVVAEVNASRAPADRVLLSVDGVHGFGVEDVPVAELGCDFFVAGCHKWMLGPRGTGLVWGRGEGAWSAVRSTIPTFGGGSPGSEHTPGGFKPFEHRWALREAFELHEQIGRTQIAARIQALNQQLKQGLSEMPHVQLRTPMAEELSAGLVCFDVAGLSPRQVVERLHARNIIATTTPYTPQYARLSAGLMNAESQVETVLGALRGLG
jgi:isopenicillin-N epimerase